MPSRRPPAARSLIIPTRSTPRPARGPQAYRDLALKWHPDKQKTEADKELATKEFQQVGEAYEILSDEDLRAKYDRGEDVLKEQAGNPQQQHRGFPFAHFQQGGGRRTHHFHSAR